MPVDLNDYPHRVAVALALKTKRKASWERVMEAVNVRGDYAVTGAVAAFNKHLELEREIARLEAPQKENDSE